MGVSISRIDSPGENRIAFWLIPTMTSSDTSSRRSHCKSWRSRKPYGFDIIQSRPKLHQPQGKQWPREDTEQHQLKEV